MVAIKEVTDSVVEMLKMRQALRVLEGLELVDELLVIRHGADAGGGRTVAVRLGDRDYILDGDGLVDVLAQVVQVANLEESPLTDERIPYSVEPPVEFACEASGRIDLVDPDDEPFVAHLFGRRAVVQS